MLRSLSTRAHRFVRTPRRRKLAALGVSLALIGGPLALLPSPASADAVSSLEGSPFNGTDGNLDQTPAVSVTPDSGTGNNDNSYTQGAKENDLCPAVEFGSIPPSKADLSNLYVGTAKGSNGHTFLYLGWSRTDTNGTVTLDFELNQATQPLETCHNGVNPARTVGDVLVTYDFQGGRIDALEYRIWGGSKWGDPVDILDSTEAEASINTSTLTFGEMVIDLEAAGIFTAGECENLASQLVKSRSSDSFQSELKDFIGPGGTRISNCGSLEVVKDLSPASDPGKFNLLIDGVVKAANIGDEASTGPITVNSGSHTFGETAGTATTLDDYATTTVCRDGVGTVASSNGSVNVASDQHVVCTITNTRKTGTLTVVKDLSPASDPGKFILLIDGVVKASNVGDDGSTGAVTVNTGSHTFAEAAGTGTSLGDYTTTAACRDGAGTVASSNGSVNVGNNQNVVCTITNTRKTGTLTVIKDLSPADDSGTFNLLIDGVVKASNVGDGGSTDAVTVNTGSHTFGEAAGQNTNLADYVPTSVCVAGGNTINSAGGSVTVAHNQHVVCTITNTRRTGTLTVNKVLVPANDPGKFNLQIDGVTEAAGIGNGGTTGAVTLNTGSHSFGETAGANTNLSDYESTSDCRAGTAPVTITGGSIVLGEQNVVCTITNTRKTGTLTVVKDLSPSADPGKFNLLIDGVAEASGVGGGGTTGAVTVNTGSHSVGESAGGNTSLDDYTTTTACRDDEGSVASSGGSVSVGHNQNVVCTITNTRKTGTLTVIKDLSREADPGKFNLLIDGVVKASDVGDGGTTGAVTVNTGSHSFGETAGTATSLSDYVASSSCLAGEETVPIIEGSVLIGEGDNVVCTITNGRITGSLTVAKTANGGTGTFVFDVSCSDGSNHVISIVNSGAETILDIPTGTTCVVTERDNPLFSPTVIPADGKAVIDRDGETVAFTNTAKPNGLTLDKKVNAGDHATTDDALRAHSGDPLTYTVVISNTGQVPLTITVLSDSLYPALVAACPQSVGSVLTAGASFTCTYRVAAGDDAHNVAAVSAVDDLGRPLTASDGTFVDVVHPGITIVKTASPESISVSGSVTYTYVVTNTGDTTLFDVVVTDDILGAIGRVGELAPGESVTMATTVDVDALTPPRNIGTAVGTDALGQTVTANDDAVITVVLGAVLAQPELPRTGAPLHAQAWAALAMIQVGLVLTLAGRRRRVIRRAD